MHVQWFLMVPMNPVDCGAFATELAGSIDGLTGFSPKSRRGLAVVQENQSAFCAREQFLTPK